MHIRINCVAINAASKSRVIRSKFYVKRCESDSLRFLRETFTSKYLKSNKRLC